MLVKLRPSQRIAGCGVAREPAAAVRRARGQRPTASGSAPSRSGSSPTCRTARRRPWDLAHARVADQLGVAESDVIFAEPDLVHDDLPGHERGRSAGRASPSASNCDADPAGRHARQGGRPDAVRLAPRRRLHRSSARRAPRSTFTDPRTRIAHLDTGYYRAHVTVPEHVLRGPRAQLRRAATRDPSSAEDPDNRVLLLDNSGHGTGTLEHPRRRHGPGLRRRRASAARPTPRSLPLRIADSVVLLRTSALRARARLRRRAALRRRHDEHGRVPSRAWREAVDQAYVAGLCIVRRGGQPRRHRCRRDTLVYPARYRRVIAVVRRDGRRHSRTPASTGPRRSRATSAPTSAMKAAIAAYTPNIPWARFGCADIVRLNGEGTSSATPQVAAAVALWFEKYKNELPRDWRRVEAVRHALFTTAKLKARPRSTSATASSRRVDALAVKPVLDAAEERQSDSDSFAFLRVLTGLGIAEAPPRERMFNLELAQRWLLNPELQELVPDPDATRPARRARRCGASWRRSSRTTAPRSRCASTSPRATRSPPASPRRATRAIEGRRPRGARRLATRSPRSATRRTAACASTPSIRASRRGSTPPGSTK